MINVYRNVNLQENKTFKIENGKKKQQQMYKY